MRSPDKKRIVRISSWPPCSELQRYRKNN